MTLLRLSSSSAYTEAQTNCPRYPRGRLSVVKHRQLHFGIRGLALLGFVIGAARMPVVAPMMAPRLSSLAWLGLRGVTGWRRGGQEALGHQGRFFIGQARPWGLVNGGWRLRGDRRASSEARLGFWATARSWARWRNCFHVPWSARRGTGR